MKQSESFLLVVLIAGFAALVAKLRILMERCVPVGYEDESGFHVGVDRGEQ